MISRLFQPVDNAWLIFFRMIFGLLGFIEVCINFFYYHLYKDAFNPGYFQFNYIGFEWLDPLPEPFMSLFFILMGGAALAILSGYYYRWAASFFAVGITYIFLLEKAHYLNHGYLFCLLSFIMIFLPAGKRFSLDELGRRITPRDQCYFYERWILPMTMGVVYFFGGIAKLNADWLRAQPLKLWMEYKSRTHFLGSFLEWDLLPYFLSYGGLLFDLTIVFLLLSKRTRVFGLVLFLFFHLTNFILFEIGIFPWLSIALSLMFFPVSSLWNTFHWLDKKWGYFHKIYRRYRGLRMKFALPRVPPSLPGRAKRSRILAVLFIYLIYHIVMPLRHHYFPGDVAWTEEGHRYAWRMMLRSKAGYGTFTVIGKEKGQKEVVKPSGWLRGKQKRKLYTHPDMILQFAHHIRDTYRERGWEEVEVYANIRVKLNDGEYHPYIDPTVNLAETKWSFFRSSPWILPEGSED